MYFFSSILFLLSVFDFVAVFFALVGVALGRRGDRKTVKCMYKRKRWDFKVVHVMRSREIGRQRQGGREVEQERDR